MGRRLLTLIALACAFAAVGAAQRVRLGGVSVGMGYSRWCCAYPWLSYPAWDPFFYHPGYYWGFAAGPNLGEVRLRADRKDAEVFLDGAYAGTAAERKSMWIEPGAYNLEVRAAGKITYTKRIYVLSWKSLLLMAKLEAQP